MRNSMKSVTIKKSTIYLFFIGLLFSCASEPIATVNIAPPYGKTYRNSLGIEFVQIQAGEFQMGCSKGDTECDDDEKPIHNVKILNPFYLGKFEVTQRQWMMLMGDNPSKFIDCGINCPVESVSWNDVQKFIERLCTREKYSPCKYRLPTEAEWEYSARAGSKTKYYWGDKINDAYLWYKNNSVETTHIVGKKEPNGWELYDMIGNVLEWVGDYYDSDYYKNSPANDPKAINSGDLRVLRGGSWAAKSDRSSLSSRSYGPPDRQGGLNIGFRLVLLP
jgi:formylglycine-generating enzyme required for sulfatase activity